MHCLTAPRTAEPEPCEGLGDGYVFKPDARLHALADSIDHIVWSTDASGVFDFANARWEEYTRQSASAAADGSGWLPLLHPEDRERTWTAFQRSITSGTLFECEYRLRRWDGEYRWHLSRGAPHRSEHCVIERWIGTLTDVDDLKRANAALRESESRFRDIAENIREVFWLVSADQKVMYVSPAYEEIWGRSVESCYADDLAFLEAVHPDDRESVAAALKTKNSGSGVEYRIVRPDGEIRWIHDRAFPIADAAGNVVRVAGIAEDITARRALEQSFRQAQKMEAVGRLAGGIAHDLNNMLTVIKGHAEFLSLDIAPYGESREDLDQITKSAERAATLTRQLLAFSRQQVMEKQEVDANQLLRDLERIVAGLIGGDIQLSLCLNDSAVVFADASQIEQAIMNLVINARDAMPQGGNLGLATRTVFLDSHEASRHPEARPGHYVAIDVSDTGTGIEPELLVKVFEPFFTTKMLGKGTGLGLATVYGIAQQSGGFVDVESVPGSGSTFTLYVPAAAESAAIPQAAPGGGKPGNELILLVEDQDEVRRVARRILTARGYRVVEARNGIEALALLKAPDSGVDLVLTDAVMPLMSGTDLVRALRANNPAMPVIIASGYTDPELVSYCTGELKVPFLAKPFRSDELVRIVRETI
ncbi:MAG: PAS domain-containing protein, partial [Gemmatimonadaceae bacterium]